MPRPSQKKTTPAVLRSLIGLRDTEMAALLGCSVNTIWSVESGRLKLSEQLAKKMSHQTGVSMEWLLNGDPGAQPFTTRSGPRPWREFTRQEFESHAALMKAVDHSPKSTFSYDYITLAAKLRRILHTANQAHNYHLARWKITRALDELARELDAPPTKDRVPDTTTDLQRRLRKERDPALRQRLREMSARDAAENPGSDAPKDIAYLLKRDVDRFLKELPAHPQHDEFASTTETNPGRETQKDLSALPRVRRSGD